jgi:hypothetical protein
MGCAASPRAVPTSRPRRATPCSCGARVERATIEAAGRYRASFFPGRMCLFLPVGEDAKAVDMPERWRAAAERVEEYPAPAGCNTDNMLREPHVAAIAELFRRCCA